MRKTISVNEVVSFNDAVISKIEKAVRKKFKKKRYWKVEALGTYSPFSSEYRITFDYNINGAVENFDEEAEKLVNDLKKMEVFSSVSYVHYNTSIFCTLDKKHYVDDRTWVNESKTEYEMFIKNCQNNPTYKKACAIAKKYGYDVAELCYVEKIGNTKKVYFGFNYDTNKYKPEITYNTLGNNQGFMVQTSSYGKLDIKEHTKFLEEITNANKMVKELSKLDLTTLYEYSEEE